MSFKFLNFIKQNIFIIIFIIFGAYILSVTVYHELKLYFAYPLGIWDTLPSFGNNCECSSGIWNNDSDNFFKIKNKTHNFKKCILPLRKEPNPPRIPSTNGYFIARCILKVKELNLEKFGWINLGIIIGHSAIFLNDNLILTQNDNEIVEFPINISYIKQNEDNTITIIAKHNLMNKLGLGPKTLVPLVITDKRSDVKKYDRLLNFWFVEYPVLIIFLCFGFFIIFCTFWLCGLRYPDLEWIIIILVSKIGSVFIFYYPTLINYSSILHDSNFQIYQVFKGLSMIFTLPFLYCFLRLKIQFIQSIKTIITLFIILYIISGVISYKYFTTSFKIIENISWYICSVLYLILAILGFNHAKTLKDTSIKRYIYCGITVIFSMLTFVLLILQSLFSKKYDFEPMPIITLIFIVLFGITLVADLALFRIKNKPNE